MNVNAILWGIIIGCIVCILAALFIVFSPIIILLAIFGFSSDLPNRKNYREFLKQHEGQRFFCYTSRKTSRLFIEENVLPLLNKDIAVIYLEGKTPRSSYEEEHMSSMLFWIRERKGFPNVMVIRNGKVVDKSLKESFYNAMNQQEDIREVIADIDRFFEIHS